MSYLLNNQQKITDVIFTGRNKNYGAYQLRSTYGFTLFKSLSFMLLGFGSMLLSIYYLSNKNNAFNQLLVTGQVFDRDSVYVIKADLRPKEPLRPETKAVQKSDTRRSDLAKNDNQAYKLVDSISNTEMLVHNDLNTLASTTGSNIETGDGTNDSKTGNEGGNGGEIIPETPFDPTTWGSEPEFEGGLKALYRFVSSQLRYPEPAYESGKEGTVYVKFIVDETGKVGGLTLLNRQGFGLDEEALRVVSMIPKFKSPAKYKNRPVKAYYQLPIKFSQR